MNSLFKTIFEVKLSYLLKTLFPGRTENEHAEDSLSQYTKSSE